MLSIINFFKAIIIGIALVIPGLSCSIFAVIVGLYDKMIGAVNNIRKSFKKSICFLIPIGLGVIIGILLSAKLIVDICEKYPQQSYFFFIGLVLGSIPLVLRKMKKVKFRPAYLLITVISICFILLMGFLSSNGNNGAVSESVYKIKDFSDALMVFFAGFFSCASMSIPGISGSVALMVLGQYNKVYGAVGEFAEMFRFMIIGDFKSASNSAESVWTVLIFAVGGIIAIALLAKIVGKLLEKFEAQVYYGVAGMIIGAIIILFTQGVMLDKKFSSMINGLYSDNIKSIVIMLLIDILMIIIGTICTLLLDDDSKTAKNIKEKGKCTDEKNKY